MTQHDYLNPTTGAGETDRTGALDDGRFAGPDPAGTVAVEPDVEGSVSPPYADRPWDLRPDELPLFPTAAEVSGPLAERDHLDAMSGEEGAGGHHVTDDSAGPGRHVVRGSMWYIAAVATGAVFSFAYWVLAAHAATKDVYSVGTALWVDVQFINFITGMGLPVAVARYGALRQRAFHVLFLWALIYTASASALGAVTFGVAAPAFVRDDVTSALWQFGKPAGALIFFALTAGMSLGLLVEVRLVTLRQWKWVYGRVIAISLIRLPFLLIPAVAGNPLGLLLLIAGPMALSGFIGIIVLFVATAKSDRGRLFPLPPQTRGAFKYANVNYVGMLAAQGPQFIIPVIVAWSVSGDFAPFFIAWSITVVIFLVPHTISQVVLSEGSRKSASRDKQLKQGLKLSVGLMCVATVGTLVGAGVLPLVFPNGYELAVVLLPRFVAAGIPWAVTCMCLAQARVEGNHRSTVIITVGFALFTVIPTSVMSAQYGPDGAASAWLMGNIAAAVLAFGVSRVQPDRKADLVPSAARVDVS